MVQLRAKPQPSELNLLKNVGDIVSDPLERKTFGLIMRCYAIDESSVDMIVYRATLLAERAAEIRVRGRALFKLIDILVWADPRFRTLPEKSDWSDCGKTKEALDNHPVVQNLRGKVFVKTITNGDLYCKTLNFGVAWQTRRKIDFSVIASPYVLNAFTDENLTRMYDAFAGGARAVAFEVYDSDGVEVGRLSNAFCGWENESLITCGGFDMIAAKPHDQRMMSYKRAWSDDGATSYCYHEAGSEEVVPLARMAEHYPKRCIAPLRLTDPSQGYLPPDKTLHPLEFDRHIQKLATMRARQDGHLKSMGYDPVVLRNGVMSGYGWRA